MERKVLPLEMRPDSVTGVLDGVKRQTRRLAASASGRPNPMTRLEPGDWVWLREDVVWRASGLSAPVYAARRGINEPHVPGVNDPVDVSRRPQGWTPRDDATRARFMPRWARRVLVEVTGRRVEPLQALTVEDALAEGIVDARIFKRNMAASAARGALSLDRRGDALSFAYYGAHRLDNWMMRAPLDLTRPDPVKAYQALWDRMHREGPGWWDNPDVVVLSFRRVPGHAGDLLVHLETEAEAKAS